MVVTEGNLAKDINFIKTPAAQPSSFEKTDCNVPTTDVSHANQCHFTQVFTHICRSMPH